MADNDAVIIKGIRGGLLVLLDDREEYSAVLAELRDRLDDRAGFFRGATVTINLGRRVIDEPELAGLCETLLAFDVQIDTLVSSAEESRTLATTHGIPNRPPTFARRKEKEPPPTPPAQAPEPRPPGAADELDFAALADAPEEQPSAAAAWHGAGGGLFLRRTLRSGQSIQHDGDICIIGDVNPGAEIIGGGDVVVWGSLRGVVHAGASGDTNAVICALQLAPTQLRIADMRSRSPETGGSGPRVTPEIARSVNGQIVVEAWTGLRTRR
jgi:septum site-determining protein MinC